MAQNWVEPEISECDFGDVRLNRRLGKMLQALGERPGDSLPTAFQDWANTKAAYRFFDNDAVSEDKILAGHFRSTAQRIQATDGPILILQDTTDFAFKRANPEKIGFTGTATGPRQRGEWRKKYLVCGMLMHLSLAITPEGLPLGLTAAKFWSRDKFKGTTAMKRKVNPTRMPIEEKESMRWLDNLRRSTELSGAPERCVHIGDRESDIFELYCLAQELGTQFLVRSCVDRLAEDGDTTISRALADIVPSGTHNIRFRDANGVEQSAELQVKFASMMVCPPIGKQKKCSRQELQIIHAEEVCPPEGRAPICWKLITNLAVKSHEDAVHKLQWYALRWRIETFFKTLKTGCKVEDIRLTTADRLANCIALCCVVAWRVSWLTMLTREAPKASPASVFTKAERRMLELATPDRKRQEPYNLSFYVKAVARLGVISTALPTRRQGRQ